MKATILFALALAASPLAAQEPAVPLVPGGTAAEAQAAAHEGPEAENEPSNELAVFLGGTRESDETHFTAGAEYERRLGERLGIGLVVEHVADVDAWVVLAPFSIRPAKGLGLKLYAGPGFESKVPREAEGGGHGGEVAAEPNGRETFFVARGGVGWSLEIGPRASVTPQVEVDFVRESGTWESSLVFGVAIGFGF